MPLTGAAKPGSQFVSDGEWYSPCTYTHAWIKHCMRIWYSLQSSSKFICLQKLKPATQASCQSPKTWLLVYLFFLKSPYLWLCVSLWTLCCPANQGSTELRLSTVKVDPWHLIWQPVQDVPCLLPIHQWT